MWDGDLAFIPKETEQNLCKSKIPTMHHFMKQSQLEPPHETLMIDLYLWFKATKIPVYIVYKQMA